MRSLKVGVDKRRDLEVDPASVVCFNRDVISVNRYDDNVDEPVRDLAGRAYYEVNTPASSTAADEIVERERNHELSVTLTTIPRAQGQPGRQ